MLVTSIFSFSHNLFCTVKGRNYHFSNIIFIVCICVQFGQGQNFVVWWRLKPLLVSEMQVYTQICYWKATASVHTDLLLKSNCKCIHRSAIEKQLQVYTQICYWKATLSVYTDLLLKSNCKCIHRAVIEKQLKCIHRSGTEKQLQVYTQICYWKTTQVYTQICYWKTTRVYTDLLLKSNCKCIHHHVVFLCTFVCFRYSNWRYFKGRTRKIYIK